MKDVDILSMGESVLTSHLKGKKHQTLTSQKTSLASVPDFFELDELKKKMRHLETDVDSLVRLVKSADVCTESIGYWELVWITKSKEKQKKSR